jgi:hypothetical protein
MQPEGLGRFRNSPHRVSTTGPSGLQHSALTTTLPLVARKIEIIYISVRRAVDFQNSVDTVFMFNTFYYITHASEHEIWAKVER